MCQKITGMRQFATILPDLGCSRAPLVQLVSRYSPLALEPAACAPATGTPGRHPSLLMRNTFKNRPWGARIGSSGVRLKGIVFDLLRPRRHAPGVAGRQVGAGRLTGGWLSSALRRLGQGVRAGVCSLLLA